MKELLYNIMEVFFVLSNELNNHGEIKQKEQQKRIITIGIISVIIITLVALLIYFQNHQSPGSSILQPDENLLELETVRNEVINKFKNEREVLGTSKFIEDAYKEYPDDEIISTIYNYGTSKFCYDVYIDYKNEPVEGMDGSEWLDKAISYASKISPDYDRAFSEEIIPYVSELLGDDWETQRQETMQQEEKFNQLTMEDKKEIIKYIQSRYDYYDSQEGGYSGDKYSDTIFKEASEKFGLPEFMITAIWTDTEVTKQIGKEQIPDKEIVVHDAILNYENGDSIIAANEESLDRFMNALVNGDEGTVDELFQNQQIAKARKGTLVNIIERKATRTKVKILDGIYKDNEVWVLMESVQE